MRRGSQSRGGPRLRLAGRPPLLHEGVVDVPVTARDQAGEVIDQLRDQVSSGERQVGSRIPTENELATQLGVGRNTVREAIRVLTHAGMLECRQGAGTFVVAASEAAAGMARRLAAARLHDIIEVRRGLEVE